MKKYKFIGLLTVAMLAVSSLWSCSDDNEPTPLEKSEIAAGDVTYESLTFRWNKVAGARQYSYQLVKTSNEAVIETGVTKDTAVSFTGLEHDTEYTLTVLAYAAMNSGNTTSEPIVLTARTNDLVTLPTPEVTWTRELNSVIFNWGAVTGTYDYAYTLTDADGNVVDSGSTYSTSVNFTDMQSGTYTFSVTAQTQNAGYRNSQPGSVTFEFVRQREELWRATGSYTSSLLGSSWTAVLVAYDDNSYQLLSWYGVQGCDLNFSLDETDPSDMFRPDPTYTYSSSTDSYSVPTGLSTPAAVNLFASGNRCAFEGSAGSGTIVLRVSDGTNTGNDKFQWGLTIQDLVGTWTCDFAAYDVSDPTYDEFYNAEVEITLGSEENTLIVPMPNYYGYLGSKSVMTVDMNTMTFTMLPVDHGGVFTFAGLDSETQPLTGRISGSAIVFDAIQAWYSGYYYLSSNSYLKYTR